CHAPQEIRYERRVIFGSKIGEHLAKRGKVIVGRIIGELHPSNHNAHSWISRFHLIDDLLKIILDLINRHSSKDIVDSELQNEDIDLTFQMTRKPLKAAFRGAAGGAGIDYSTSRAGCAQFLCTHDPAGLA